MRRHENVAQRQIRRGLFLVYETGKPDVGPFSVFAKRRAEFGHLGAVAHQKEAELVLLYPVALAFNEFHNRFGEHSHAMPRSERAKKSYNQRIWRDVVAMPESD